MPRSLALVTGACGGMGQSVARAFGVDHDLLIVDVAADRLAAFAAALGDEGYTVTDRIAGDLADQAVIEDLFRRAPSGRLGTIVHTAGLSPAQADWDVILRVNVVATERLLRAVEVRREPCVAIVIASMAGYFAETNAAIDGLLDDPLERGFISAIEPLFAAPGLTDNRLALRIAAYFASKRAVQRSCERRAAAWGAWGARIVSISPGMIRTPMALREVAANPRSQSTLEATPLGRWGTPMEIAQAARFLASDAAAFVTGCDLRVDGGVTAALLHP